MTLKETKTEMNKTLSMVPVGIWKRFRGACNDRDLTLTQGFIEAFKLWEKKAK